ncbi:hypothetical protein N431DRAFT_468209 [Stipitochalara longipes BDJ]|nr:hypothetical protein N431DRAFT_468209 [Stipitochalara longipes BDJ]
MSTPRTISKIFLALEQAEGAGATVRRSIGSAQLRQLSPFLLLDHFSSSSLAGFPDHPHRGQETITYILAGSFLHEDFTGSKGRLESGGLQFMTAGRGIMHSEIPRPNPDGSPNVGLQLWVDLPKRLKMCEPRYRDLQKSEIPVVQLDGGKVSVKVIAGKAGGVERGEELAYTPVWYLDFEVRPGGRVSQEVPRGWNAFAYLLSGTAVFGSGEGKRGVERFHNVVFSQNGDSVEVAVEADAKENAHFVLIAGQPLDQPVVRLGPFVMTTEEEVQQAMRDFRRFENGFERARGWESVIGRGAM